MKKNNYCFLSILAYPSPHILLQMFILIPWPNIRRPDMAGLYIDMGDLNVVWPFGDNGFLDVVSVTFKVLIIFHKGLFFI